MAVWSGPADKATNSNSSMRAELFGIASSLLFLTTFIAFHKIETNLVVHIWSDSNFLTWKKHPDRPPANAEIVSSISALMKKLPITTKILWITAHQDDLQPKPISYEAEMNVKTDQLAPTYLQHKTEKDGGPLNNSWHFSSNACKSHSKW